MNGQLEVLQGRQDSLKWGKHEGKKVSLQAQRLCRERNVRSDGIQMLKLVVNTLRIDAQRLMWPSSEPIQPSHLL